jgi:hypothetical protein
MSNWSAQARCRTMARPYRMNERNSRVGPTGIKWAKPATRSDWHFKPGSAVYRQDHLRFVAKQPCLVCGRQPCDAHHLRFAPSRGLSLKVSDEFTVSRTAPHRQGIGLVGESRSRAHQPGAQALAGNPPFPCFCGCPGRRQREARSGERSISHVSRYGALPIARFFVFENSFKEIELNISTTYNCTPVVRLANRIGITK